MKIQVDGADLMDVKPWEMKVLQYQLPTEGVEDDLKRRLKYIISHKIERCIDQMINDWMPKIRKDKSITSVPTDKKSLVEMIMNRPDYKDRSTREEEMEFENTKPPIIDVNIS